MAKKKKTIIFQLECEDHSQLGGRMGTETTRTLWTELFWERDSAVEFVIYFCKRKKADSHIIREAKKLKYKDAVDAYRWGFSITKKEIN